MDDLRTDEFELGIDGPRFWTQDTLRRVVERVLGYRQFVVVSNREPYIHRLEGEEIICERPVSGMVTALEPVMRVCGGSWVARCSTPPTTPGASARTAANTSAPTSCSPTTCAITSCSFCFCSTRISASYDSAIESLTAHLEEMGVLSAARIGQSTGPGTPIGGTAVAGGPSELVMMSHVLPPLPYDFRALQPWIDEPSLRLHYDYHRTRVDALNAAEAQLAAQATTADFAWLRYLQRVAAMRASEHVMHCLFWEMMGPNPSGAGSDALVDQIREDFGSLATFKSQFCGAAVALEAEEWLALVWQPASARLIIRPVDYAQLPCDWAVAILLVLDVGEHAYYLQYQNRRMEYVHNWWNIVNWLQVAKRFTAATQPWPRAAGSRTGQTRRRQRKHRSALPLCVEGASQPPR